MAETRDRRGRRLKDLRISVTDSCNFRCGYCMPREIFGEPLPFLQRDEHLSYEEIAEVAAAAASLGVRKIKITGGEPLLRPWLHELVAMLDAIEGIDDIGLITNGYHLESHAKALMDAGLHRVTISLDSLDEERFSAISGKGGSLGRVLSAIDAAYEMGFRPLKINMVVQNGVNDCDIPAMVERFRRPGIELRFIEFMDVGHHMNFDPALVLPNSEILSSIRRNWHLEPVDPRNSGEVASRYRHADGNGEVGFISSMSNPFCGDCNRLRLTANGELYTCLFSRQGYDVKSALRNQGAEELHSRIKDIWGNRDDAYSENRSRDSSARAPRGNAAKDYTGFRPIQSVPPEMYHIGG